MNFTRCLSCFPPNRAGRFLNEIAGRATEMGALIDASYLEEPMKTRYKAMIGERSKALRYSCIESIQ